MKKEMQKDEQQIERAVHDIAKAKVEEVLKDSSAGFVLITCSLPKKDGRMDVEMSFDGDPDLAAYLVDNAKQVFDAKENMQKTK